MKDKIIQILGMKAGNMNEKDEKKLQEYISRVKAFNNRCETVMRMVDDKDFADELNHKLASEHLLQNNTLNYLNENDLEEILATAEQFPKSHSHHNDVIRTLMFLHSVNGKGEYWQSETKKSCMDALRLYKDNYCLSEINFFVIIGPCVVECDDDITDSWLTSWANCICVPEVKELIDFIEEDFNRDEISKSIIQFYRGDFSTWYPEYDTLYHNWTKEEVASVTNGIKNVMQTYLNRHGSISNEYADVLMLCYSAGLWKSPSDIDNFSKVLCNEKTIKVIDSLLWDYSRCKHVFGRKRKDEDPYHPAEVLMELISINHGNDITKEIIDVIDKYNQFDKIQGTYLAPEIIDLICEHYNINRRAIKFNPGKFKNAFCSYEVLSTFTKYTTQLGNNNNIIRNIAGIILHTEDEDIVNRLEEVIDSCKDETEAEFISKKIYDFSLIVPEKDNVEYICKYLLKYKPDYNSAYEIKNLFDNAIILGSIKNTELAFSLTSKELNILRYAYETVTSLFHDKSERVKYEAKKRFFYTLNDKLS